MFFDSKMNVLSKKTITFFAFFLYNSACWLGPTSVSAYQEGQGGNGNGNGGGYGPGDGTGTGDAPGDGTGNGPGDCDVNA